jgi:hypothetical protein
LSVTLRVQDGEARLEIADSGSKDGPPPHMGPGVGRTLMTAFARQLGGKVDFEPNQKGGLTALLTFPVREPMAEPVAETPPAPASRKPRRNSAAA